jgi:hypothetical protein
MTGQKPCKGNKIPKGTLRLGTWVELKTPSGSNGSFKWRHWGCGLLIGRADAGTTEKVISNLKEQFDKADEVDGYDDLP